MPRSDFKVMVSQHGTPTTVNTNSKLYAEMLQSNNYTEHCSGTKKYCDEQKEVLLGELADAE